MSAPMNSAVAARLYEALDDLIGLAEVSMLSANRGGSEYDIKGETEDARAALNLAKSYGIEPTPHRCKWAAVKVYKNLPDDPVECFSSLTDAEGWISNQPKSDYFEWVIWSWG